MVKTLRRKAACPTISTASYAVRLARQTEDVRAALALWFEAFNSELIKVATSPG